MPPCTHTARLLFQVQRLSAALCLLSLCLVGCGETEQVSRYSVPKKQSPAADADDVQPFTAEGGPVSAWIYKLLGPAEAVASQRNQFDALVESTTLSDGTAQWTTPEGWSQQSGSGIRFATLTVEGSDPGLELSVTRLPLFGKRDDYLLQNINRWRGQISIPAMSGDNWLAVAKEAGEVEQSDGDGLQATVVAIQGETDEFGESMMLAAILLPEAGKQTQPPATEPSAPPRVPSTPAADVPLTYEAPEQWQPGKKSIMRVAAFQVSDDDKQVEITVIPAGGDLLSNVNRWRTQVGLEAWSDDELKKNSEELSVGQATASYVQLAGAEQTILAAVLPDGGQSWFFKLMGDPGLAQQEEQRFKTFVESVRLKSK